MDLKTYNNLPFYIKLTCVLFSLFAIGYLVIIGKEILSPLIFSCLFSILLLPVAAFFESKLHMPRSAASMLSVLLLLFFIGSLIFVIGSQIADLAKEWPQFQEQINKTLWELRGWIQDHFNISRGKQLRVVNTAANKVISADNTAVFGATVLSLTSILLFLVFTFIYTFFFLLYRRLIMKFLQSVFLDENKSIVHEIIEQVQYMIRKYIIGLLIEMGIVAISISVIFSIMDVRYAILLGLITGLFNIIPYIGIFTALIISSVVTLGTSPESTKVIWVVITLVVTHLIDSNVLLPLVVGSKVRINALITVLGVIVGEMIWGIPGMFLSIPVIAVLKIIFDRVESLKPWGIILGDEEAKQNKLATKLGIKKKKVAIGNTDD
ncbi:MAG: AI-2E family transporter [Bacteroidetes bacterium]|nr:AI-2E family transporter [Bacteroidota bacterium]MBU1373559.1 AI-2E family transporter [Bacteroidota bacterium]MBU1484390.1 AI-2E family transporter [Bacteroidota bacterium]MBU1759433.1 AI-2E family transporter [Bacteroidota bacterium]MBU2045710.1 AI-2E family transporter [Bacteroidota bacterium]